MPPQEPLNAVPVSSPVVPLTVGKFKASMMIVSQSLMLLKKDKEIMWFPVLSIITSLFMLVIFGAILFLVAFGGTFMGIDSVNKASANVLSYAVLFVYYLLMFFITNFYTAGIFVIVHGRLNGQDLSFSDGMNGAKANASKIFLWSVISATVGVILAAIENRFKDFGKIIAALFGAAWNMLTYFSLPSLVIGKASVTESFKQSASLIRKTWGETIIVNLGVGLYMTLLVFLAIMIAVGIIALFLCFRS